MRHTTEEQRSGGYRKRIVGHGLGIKLYQNGQLGESDTREWADRSGVTTTGEKWDRTSWNTVYTVHRPIPNASIQSRYEAPASMRRARASRHSEGIPSPLDSAAIRSFTPKQSPSASRSALKSCRVRRKKRRNSLSGTRSRPRSHPSRKRQTGWYSRGDATAAHITARTMDTTAAAAARVTAVRAPRRGGRRTPRTAAIRRLPADHPRVHIRRGGRGAMIGGVACRCRRCRPGGRWQRLRGPGVATSVGAGSVHGPYFYLYGRAGTGGRCKETPVGLQMCRLNNGRCPLWLQGRLLDGCEAA